MNYIISKRGGIMMIRVGVMGAGGRMGREICRSVVAEEGLELVAAFDRSYQGMEIGALIGMPVEGVLVETDLDKLLDSVEIDVMIDFTVADAMVSNFQLPYSTQLMMVAAFGGYDLVMNAYKIAKEEGYRFGTYGDAMLIL